MAMESVSNGIWNCVKNFVDKIKEEYNDTFLDDVLKELHSSIHTWALFRKDTDVEKLQVTIKNMKEKLVVHFNEVQGMDIYNNIISKMSSELRIPDEILV